MLRHTLPAPQSLSMHLDDILRARTSFTTVPDENGFTTEELGTLLGLALGVRGEITRTYPSGGALYPVETYLIGTVFNEKAFGAFHYHPKMHALEELWALPPRMSDYIRYNATPTSTTLLVFTAVWQRTSATYGDWSYDHAILEAGHMAQNVLLVATALGLSARPVLGFNDEALTRELDLDEREQPIYSVLLARGATKPNVSVIYE